MREKEGEKKNVNTQMKDKELREWEKKKSESSLSCYEKVLKSKIWE